MQRTCSSTHSLSKGLLRLSHSEKLSPIYYRHYIRNYSSVFNRSANYSFSLPNRIKPRYASSSSGGTKSGGGKAALLGGFTVVSLVGGTLGYAGIDSDFRAYIEELVPGAKEAFEAILGNVKSTERYVNRPSCSVGGQVFNQLFMIKYAFNYLELILGLKMRMLLSVMKLFQVN